MERNYRNYYLLEFKREDEKFPSTDWTLLTRNVIRSKIDLEMVELYNYAIQEENYNSSFITSSMYEDKCEVIGRGYKIYMRIREVEVEE